MTRFLRNTASLASLLVAFYLHNVEEAFAQSPTMSIESSERASTYVFDGGLLFDTKLRISRFGSQGGQVADCSDPDGQCLSLGFMTLAAPPLCSSKFPLKVVTLNGLRFSVIGTATDEDDPAITYQIIGSIDQKSVLFRYSALHGLDAVMIEHGGGSASIYDDASRLKAKEVSSFANHDSRWRSLISFSLLFDCRTPLP